MGRPRKCPGCRRGALRSEHMHDAHAATGADGIVRRWLRMMANAEGALPSGWAARTSRSTGVTYYINTLTGETTFDLPQHAAVPKSAGKKRQKKKAGVLSGRWCGAPEAGARRADPSQSHAQPQAPRKQQLTSPRPVALSRELSGNMADSDGLVMMNSLDYVAGAAEATVAGRDDVELPAGWTEEKSVDGTVVFWMNSLTGETTNTFPTRAVFDEFELDDWDSIDDIDGSQPDPSTAEAAALHEMAESPELPGMSPITSPEMPEGSPVTSDEDSTPQTRSVNTEPPPRLNFPDKHARAALFREIDVNGNGGLSLAEIDKAVVDGVLGRALQHPDFDHKPALMRAYKAADFSADGFIEKREFMSFLRYLVYFNNLWTTFESIDCNHDRRLNATEFAAGCETIGLPLTPEEAQAEFAQCDTDGGGMVLFDEFCTWCARRDQANGLATEASDTPQASSLRTTPKWSEHKRRVRRSPARKVGGKSPKAQRHGQSRKQTSDRTNGSRGGGQPKRNVRGSVDMQPRSPSRGPRGSETDDDMRATVSQRSSNGVGPRWSPRTSSSNGPSRPASPDRKPTRGRMNKMAKASAERLSSPSRLRKTKSGGGRPQTPPRSVSAQVAGLSLSRSGRGEIFSSNDWHQPRTDGGFNTRLTKAELRGGIPAYDPSQDKYLPPKTRRMIAQRLSQAEQLGELEDAMQAGADNGDRDIADVGAGAASEAQDQVGAESRARDADALAAQYLALDSAAQARFRKKCGLCID